MPMARLRELIEELGYTDVRTYVQSGNVVFTGPGQDLAQLTEELERGIEETFGFAVSVVMRSREELADIVRANPLGELATDPARYLVLFLEEDLDGEVLAGIEPADIAPEVFEVRGREIYVWSPEGIRNSRVAKEFAGRRPGVTATARNWRTVEKLLAMADMP